MRSKRDVLELLNAVVFGLTIMGANVAIWLSIDLPLVYQIPITLCLIAVYFFVAYQKTSERTHSFVERSPKFVKFFEEWYSQPGKLSVFCSDLDWLDGQASAGIVYALQQKGDRLNLYLRDTDGKVARQLRHAGAYVYRIKPSVKTRHRLSILEQDDVRKIIVRDKDIPTNRIVFIETDDRHVPYLLSLAEDLLDDCYDEETS